MRELNFQPRCFCTLGFHINALVDKGESFSVSDILNKAENKTLIPWLEKKIDMSLWDNEDKKIMSVEFESLANVIDPERKMGVSNNGLCLLVAFCFEFIQNPPTRTLKDL